MFDENVSYQDLVVDKSESAKLTIEVRCPCLLRSSVTSAMSLQVVFLLEAPATDVTQMGGGLVCLDGNGEGCGANITVDSPLVYPHLYI